jgi:hypothetical protein
VKIFNAVLISGLLLFLSLEAQAIRVSANASVEIVEPTGFSQYNGFGKLNIDKSDSLFEKIFGNNTSKKEEYSKKIPDSEFRISGSINNSIQINVENAIKNESKVKIDDFVVNYSTGADEGDNGIVKSAPGRDAKLKLGATLKVKSDAQSGYYEPDFDIAIYYE